jgi:transcriptional regulator with XRE-family HTH domain
MIVCVNKEKAGSKKKSDLTPEDVARGQRIRDVRLSLGMTQAEFARFVGRKTDQTVSRWETGVTTPDGPDLETIEAKTSVPVRYLLHGGETDVAAPEVLIEFFRSPAGERLTGEQRRGLIMLLRDREVDAYRIQAAVDLLFPPRHTPA